MILIFKFYIFFNIEYICILKQCFVFGFALVFPSLVPQTEDAGGLQKPSGGGSYLSLGLCGEGWLLQFLKIDFFEHVGQGRH